MSEFNYDNLKEQLQSGVLNVTFTKKNGEDRDMLCTLMADKLPKVEIKEVKEGEEKKERAENRDVLAVYDLEAEGWRSFLLDTLKKVTLGG
jgi:hypothetical protein